MRHDRATGPERSNGEIEPMTYLHWNRETTPDSTVNRFRSG